MARNSRRNAFTIVELVIVIAVIAILSTVLITTFTGVIESANVSADKQLLSTMNTQISMYIGKGNDIDNADDLKKALFQGDIDYNTKLDPKSAQYGYHFWYDSAKQQIVLEKFETIKGDVAATFNHASLGRFLGGVSFAPKAVEGFEAASPRTVLPGYYFLDLKGTNDNRIAAFFNNIDNNTVLTDARAYAGLLEDITDDLSRNHDDKKLGEAIVAKMSSIAIVNSNGIFTNALKSTDGEIPVTNVYIPETEKGNTLGNVKFEAGFVPEADGFAAGAKADKYTITSTIKLPEDVKILEGTFDKFGTVKIDVTINLEGDETLKGELEKIFAAESATGEITINGSTTVTIENNKITGAGIDATLTCRNPVKSFKVSATGNIATRTGANYIAYEKLKTIKLQLIATDFVGHNDGVEGTPNVYKKVIWTSKTTGVNVDPDDGVVTFENGFSGDKIVINAKATAVKAGETVDQDFEITVVRVTGVTIKFVSGTNNGTQTMINGGAYTPPTFIVNYDDVDTSANFIVLSYQYGENITFDEGETAALGLTTPNVKIDAAGTYFTVNSDYGFGFNSDNVAGLEGSTGTEKVTVKVFDSVSSTVEAFTSTVDVKVNDNTNTPLEVVVPTYNNDYVYKVGNGTPVPFDVFFKVKKSGADFSDDTIYIYNQEPELDRDGYFHFKTFPVNTITKPTVDTKFDFTGLTGKYWIVLTTDVAEEGEGDKINEGIEESAAVSIIPIEVINGVNIIDKDDLAEAEIGEDEKPTGNYKIKGYKDTNVVLLNNIDLGNIKSNQALMALDNSHFYGNYFTITAKEFYDTDHSVSKVQDTANDVNVANAGYSLITMVQNSSINQLILDGPVYPEISSSSSENGYYFFGVLATNGGNVINDSYLFGFCSPLRIAGTTLVVNDTVLEGGTWSNMFVFTATDITFNNVTTMQNHETGYDATVAKSGYGTVGAKVLGMGIYLDDDMKGKTLNLNLNGKTEQYNWISTDTKDFGGNIKLGQDVLFMQDGDGYLYDDFFHYTPDDTAQAKPYANAAIIYQALEMTQIEYYAFGKWRSATSIMELAGYTVTESKSPTINVKVDGTIQYNYPDKVDTITLTLAQAGSIKNLLPSAISAVTKLYSEDKIRAGIDVWAASTLHTVDNPETTDVVEECHACLGYEDIKYDDEGKEISREYVVDFTAIPDVRAEFMSVVKYTK